MIPSLFLLHLKAVLPLVVVGCLQCCIYFLSTKKKKKKGVVYLYLEWQISFVSWILWNTCLQHWDNSQHLSPEENGIRSCYDPTVSSICLLSGQPVGALAAAILLSYSHRFQACCVQEQPWGKRIIGRLFQITWTQIIEGLKDRHLRRNLIIISELPGSDTILRGWATRNLTVKLEVAHGYILLRNINSIIME